MAAGAAGKNASIVIPIMCGVLLGCAGCRETKDKQDGSGQFEVDKVFERGPLTAHVRVDKSTMTIAETVLLELEAAIGQGYEVKMPKVDAVLQNFGIVDWTNCGDRLDEQNNVVSRYQYRLEPYVSGKYAIPEFKFEFYDVNSPKEKKYELATEPIDIEVTSLLGEDRDKLVIADIEGVVEMQAAASYWRLWVAGGLALVAAAASWLYLRRERHIKLARVLKPAHEIAYGRLRALVRDDLVKAGKIKEFYGRISDILRHYIEHRFELRAPERTTDEFLIELQWTEALSEGDKEGLGEFLRHCDLVKFAKHAPTTEQIQRTFGLVKDFIEKTRSDERKIDVTEAVAAGPTVEAGEAR
ncbi:MAG: hypothetical protein ACYTEQ_29245 [Planctomycetota bacterium]|jgi:hypothetical protein